MGQLRRCCCGCSTKAGTTILMWWSTVTLSSFMTVIIIQYSKGQHILAEDDWLFENYFYRAFILNLFALFVGISIMGLYGIYRNKPALLIPYLIYRVVINILSVLFLFPFLTNVIVEPRKYTDVPEMLKYPKPTEEQVNYEFDEVFLCCLGVEVIFIVLEIHFIRVIYSCYKTMRQNVNIITGEVIPLSSPCNWNNNNCYIKEPSAASLLRP